MRRARPRLRPSLLRLPLLPLLLHLALLLGLASPALATPPSPAPPAPPSASPPSAAPADAEEVFALVVANNQSLDPTLRPLRYADDDGARFHEWVSSFARRSVLLAVLDDETQRTFPELGPRARPPTRAELVSAMASLTLEMKQRRAAGKRTVFYFYFAGHGDVGADRQGYINLVDGRFSRSDLYREIIARSPADVNHLIIDACNSYFLVNSRGVQARQSSPEEAIRSFLSQESLDRYPQTGVVLSTATAAESHEWSRYRSGIFSHQLLSALWGGADVDGDGKVDYRELSAYVAAANLRVRDPRARLAIFARAPRLDRSAPLADFGRLRRLASGSPRPAPGRVAAYLEVPQGFEGHYYLEDDRGVRYADFNKSREQPLRLALLDRPYYYLRTDQGPVPREALISLAAPSPEDQQVTEGAFKEAPTRARGALELSFRRDLYAVPFGQSFFLGHVAALEGEAASVAPAVADRASTGPWRARPWKWVAGGTALATLAVAVALQVDSGRNYAQLQSGRRDLDITRALALESRADAERIGAAVLFSVSAASAVASVLLFYADRQPVLARLPGLRVARWLQPAPVAGGATLNLRIPLSGF